MVNFARVPAFNPDLDYRFSIHFTVVDEEDEYVMTVRTFKHLIPDAETYQRLVDFLTTNDDIPLYDNPAIAFQDEMEAEYGDLGVGDSGVDNEFMRFENEDTENDSDQIALMEKWRGFFERNGFPCGPVEGGERYTEDEYRKAFE